MSTKRKLTTLTLREKFNVINVVKRGMKKKDVAVQYGLSASTLSTIIKNKAEILQRYKSSNNLSCKRQRLAKFPDLEECLLAWFKNCRDKHISVSGNIFRQKAKEFSKSLGHSSFRASNGWLEKFKKRHELVFDKICNESEKQGEEDEELSVVIIKSEQAVEEEVEEVIEEDTLPNDQATKQCLQNETKGDYVESSHIDRKSPRQDSRREETQAPIPDISNEREIKDEYSAFGEVVAMKLRKICNKYARSTAQFHINNILYNAEIGKYDNN